MILCLLTYCMAKYQRPELEFHMDWCLAAPFLRVVLALPQLDHLRLPGSRCCSATTVSAAILWRDMQVILASVERIVPWLSRCVSSQVKTTMTKNA